MQGGLDSRWKVLLGLMILSSFIIIPYIYVSYEIRPYADPTAGEWPSRLPIHLDLDKLTEKGTKEKIIALAKVIYSAKKHVRGSKTSDYLNKAIHIMNNILGDIKVDSKNVYERQSVKSKHICGESYKGGFHGFPMFYEGFITDKCSYSVPVSELVTLVKYVPKPSAQESLTIELDKFIASIRSVLKDSNILIAVNLETFPNDLETKYKGVKISSSKYQSEGSALNSLIKDVKTPYVIATRNMNKFTNDTMLERLVREIESIDVVAVGGAFRETNGYWRIGCFQTYYRNYTLKYMEGYDDSFHECMFCDYIQGPFLTTAKYLKENEFKSLEENNGLYEDWFLRIGQSGRETIVCPDSMFHVSNQNIKSSSNWNEFAKTWDVFNINTASGETVTRSCENVKIAINPTKVLSPCALKVYNDATKVIMKKCEESGTICELQEGTALGAAKLGQNIQWDLDFDLRFSLTNCSACQRFEKLLKSAGVNAHLSPDCCSKTLKLGDRKNFGISFKGRYGDLTGHPVMDSQMLFSSGIPPTKLLFHGQWANAPRNPGMFLRNRYGRELYRHADHWRHTGHTNPRPNYTTNVFIPCKSPGAHNCLDRYNGDGNIQFTVMLP
ncbi:uncharacterized protein LOC132742904 [Ruditapes philippinarum]|uniref:uncharacterized protein LOC132742904 n=1 Tax=Ruditapes philippinarum TaxID=129788 RepID=UPI00295ACBE6|nr:uncharacterized protein LOC132742904 [Ruditapes philippinarum]